MLASVDVNILLEGIAGALLQHALRYSCRSRSVVCYASVCFKLIFALVCLSRVLVLPQSCISSQRLPGRWRTFSPSKRLPGRFVDGCCALRSGYLVACGWMLWFLQVDALPPWLHPPSVGDHCVDASFFGRHSWLVFCGGGPPRILAVRLCLWDSSGNPWYL